MSKRTCDKCGKEKAVDGARTCARGHFICKRCVWEPAGFFSDARSKCPLCKDRLR